MSKKTGQIILLFIITLMKDITKFTIDILCMQIIAFVHEIPLNTIHKNNRYLKEMTA